MEYRRPLARLLSTNFKKAGEHIFFPQNQKLQIQHSQGTIVNNSFNMTFSLFESVWAVKA